jgi:hypothetical protein
MTTRTEAALREAGLNVTGRPSSGRTSHVARIDAVPTGFAPSNRSERSGELQHWIDRGAVAHISRTGNVTLLRVGPLDSDVAVVVASGADEASWTDEQRDAVNATVAALTGLYADVSDDGGELIPDDDPLLDLGQEAVDTNDAPATTEPIAAKPTGRTRKRAAGGKQP